LEKKKWRYNLKVAAIWHTDPLLEADLKTDEYNPSYTISR
jgi:hypothetical protein